MPAKTLRLDGTTGVVMISDFDTPLSALTTPTPYLSKINFHSLYTFLRIKGKISQTVIDASLSPSYVTWDDGGCGGC